MRPILVLLGIAALVAAATLLIRPTPLRSSTTAIGDYANFEALQVHPLAITPDRTRLLAVNTPDARLEVFTIGAHVLDRLGEIPVGLEPVSVSAFNDDIAWVVDNVSDAVSIVNLRTFSVVATLRVGDEPTDVVFAGTPKRAFVCVSGEDAVKVYDLTDPLAPTLAVNRPIFGTHPRALAARGNEVYVGVLDAGNRTTIVSANQVQAGGGPPPPSPPRRLTSAAPEVGLIVQNVGGDWVDERPASQKTWNSVIPYSLPDRDVHVLDANSGALVRTVSDVGTNLFNLTVAPGSGNLYVTNTDAFNRTRFEPNLRGRFLQNRISRIGPGGTLPSIAWHLNSHIVYDTIPGPSFEKDLSLSQPIDIAVNSAETRVYVAALGSDKVGVFDPALGILLNRIPSSLAPPPKRGGPTGLALDEGSGQLFVLNRFANSVSIVDLVTESIVGETFLRYDPSPSEVIEGRRFLYDGTISDHGDLACSSCHISSNFDNIAWDLGDPQGDRIPVPPGQSQFLPDFDPMKGPMTTQSLRGLSGTGNLHWRADRENFLSFNPAFIKLMGNEAQLSASDMQKYSDFIMTVVYPPNPSQNLDRTWPNPSAPTPSPTRGKVEFENNHDVVACSGCHSFPTGTNGVIIPGILLQESQGFKVPHVRNMYTKSGFTNAGGPQKRGYGFIHDGSVDNLLTFLHLPVFNFQNEQQRLDLESFLLSFDTGMAPSVGRQLTLNASTKNLTSASAQLDSLYQEADIGNCDLVAHAYIDGQDRGYRYTGARRFESDYNPEGVLDADFLRGLPDALGEAITYLGVPPGAGVRMGIDRDRDGYRDRYEIALGSDPANPNSIPAVTAVAVSPSAPPARLMQNAPNPFNPSTVIAYEVARAGAVRLHVFDVAGRLVRTLVEANVPAGRHTVRWDGRDEQGRQSASGRYYYRLRVGAKVLTKDMTLLK
jgi:DNA-binding beta-propeller fold protein YncE